MAIDYKWKISSMECYPTVDSKTNVVFMLHWRLEGSETVDDKTYYGSVYSTQNVTLDPDALFVAYEDLTEAQVVGWLKDALGEEKVTQYEASVAAQIETQKNPPVVSPPLPWQPMPSQV